MADPRAPEILTVDQVTVVALGPDYDNIEDSDIERLAEHILDAARTAHPPKLLIDLSHTKFFGSSFIEVLLRAYHRIKEREGEFAVCGLGPYCAEVLEVTHLDRLWPVHESRGGAVSNLQ